MEFYLEKSDDGKKKYMVSWVNPKTERVKTIRFGAKGMTDFILSKGDKERKDRYINRHQKREDWTNLEKPGTWSRYLLWGEKTLKKSIK